MSDRHLNSPSTSTTSPPATDQSTFWNTLMDRGTSGVLPYPGPEAYIRMVPNEQATRNTNATTVATAAPSRSRTPPVQQTTPIQHWHPWHYSSQPYYYGPQPVSTHPAVPTSQAASALQVQPTPSTSSVHTWVPQSQPFPTPQPVPQPQVPTPATPSPRFISASGTVSTSSTTPLRSAPSPSPSLEPLLAPLKALQTQVTTLQGDCNTIKSDVKHVLSALNSVRSRQTQTDKRISTLEDVIGIESGCVTVKARRRTRRGKQVNRTEATAQPTPELQAPVETEDIPTLIHTLACIQSSVEKLLSRENDIPQPRRPLIYRETATSPPPFPLANSPPIVASTTLHSADRLASLPLPLSPIAMPSQDPPTLPSRSVQEKLFVEASIQTCPSPSPPERSCAFGSRRRSLTLTPVDWSNDPLTHPSAYTAEYMRFMYDNDRDLAIQNQTNVNAATSLDAQARLGRTSDVVTVDDLRRSVGVSSRLPTRTVSAPSLTSFPSAVGVGGQHDDAQSASMRTAEATSVQALLGEGRVSSVVSAPSRQGVVDGLAQVTPPRYRRASVGDLELREPETQGTTASNHPSGVPNGTGDALASISPASGSRLEADPMETRSDPVTEPEMEETEREEDRMIMDFEDDQAPGMIEMADRDSDVVMSNESESTSASPVMAQIRPSQAHPDDEDREDREEACPSGLPTPTSDGPTPGPSTAAAVTMSITRWTHDAEAEADSESLAIPNPERGGSLSRHCPVIFTPPSLTPPLPYSGEGEGEERQEKGVRRRLGDGQGMGLGSRMMSPLTPPPPSPFARRQVRVVDDDNGAEDEAGDRGETETENPTDVVVTQADIGEEDEADTGDSEEDEVSGQTPSLRRDPVYTGTAAASSSSEGIKENATSVIPAITITQDAQAATPPETNADADLRVAGDHDGSSFVTPNSSAGLPEIDLREFHPDFSTADFVDGSSYEYHVGFGSPSLHPSHPTSTTTSGYQTPSDSTHPTQDEDEVWDTLLMGLSGTSTPTSLFMYSNYPSRAQSVHPEASSSVSSQHPHQEQETETEREKEQELLSIDPSMLHYPPPQPPHEGSPHVSERSLSPLTSLDETDLEAGAHSHSTHEKRTRGTKSHTGAHGRKRLANTNKSRRSEPCHGSFTALGSSMPPTRGASEMTYLGGSGGSGQSGSRPLGGPSASLEELMFMARRQPLKIHVKVPESMRGVKRKWSAVEGEIGGGDDGETVRAGQAASTSGHVAQEPEGREMSVVTEMADEVPHANMGVALTTPAPTPPASSVPATMTDPPTTYTLEDLVRHPLPVVPSKRTKRAAIQEGSIKETPASRSRQKKTKGVSKPKSTQYSYDVENGEVVMAVPEPAPSVSVAPSPAAAPLGEETQEPSVNHERPLLEPVNHAMKTPPSSPIRPARSSGHSPRKIKQSPTKEDVWSAIAMGDGTWPELPTPFTRCDEQFIQCDNCDMWYHYGCVGIKPEDPRLEDGALFICPMCQTKSARRRALRKHDETCARPDCPEPMENTGLYFVQRLVGRKRIEGGGYLWLAKWEGYPMTKATWIPEENINTGQIVLFKSFEEDALQEGVNLSEEFVLLEEAIEAGWENHVGNI